MTPILGTIASSNQQGRGGSFEFIATNASLNGVSSVTFSSGLSSYAHLVVRYYVQMTTSANYITYRFNGDTGTNYDFKQMYWDGSNFTCDANGNQVVMTGGYSQSDNKSAGETYFLDIQNTSTFKNYIDYGGTGFSGGFTAFNGGSWRNTAAVTSITCLLTTGTWATGSRISLYGIKGS